MLYYCLIMSMILIVSYIIKRLATGTRRFFFRTQKQKLDDLDNINNALDSVATISGVIRVFIFKCFGSPDPKMGHEIFIKVLFKKGQVEGILPKYESSAIENTYMNLVNKMVINGSEVVKVADLPDSLTKTAYEAANVKYSILYYLIGDANDVIYVSVGFRDEMDFLNNDDEIMKQFKKLKKVYKNG